MNIEKKLEAYKTKISELIECVDKIVKSSLPKAEQSNQIMARLREEYIFAKNSYVGRFENASLVTIAPFSDNVKPELEEGDKEGKSDDEYCRIYANSFGPFNPIEYFKNGNFRILWLLKEPYIMKESWVKGDRGKHNQAKEYTDYFGKNGYFGIDTYDNILKLSRTILTTLKVIDEKASDNEVLNHICILEVNHFSGLAFQSPNSNDDLIGKWAEVNAEIIKNLIAFYTPNVIIGGNTIGHFYTDIPKSKHDFNSLDKYIKDKKALLSNIGLKALKIKQSTDSTSYVFDCKDSNGKTVFIVNAYHPCPKQNKEYEYTLYMAKADASLIKKWIDEKTTWL